MNYKIKFYIPLIIAVAMLIAVTLPVLGLPYCYTESSILLDSIFYLKNNGFGLVFNGTAVELPDLYSLIFAFIARFVSSAPIVLHIISLIFAVLAIMAAYNFGKFFFSVQAGVMSASIMIVQNVFLAQTGLVVPIMMLNACILGGMYFYFREKYNICTVIMCIASLTDVIGMVVSLFLLVSYMRIKYKEWTTKNCMFMALPVVLWVVYQFVSIIVCGKFSMRGLRLSTEPFVSDLWFVFVAQHRWAVTAVLVTVLAVNIVNKNMLYFVKDMAQKGAALFAVVFLALCFIPSEYSWNLVPISIMAVYTGCAISTLHTSYYSKYIIACAVIAVSALAVAQRDSVHDAYVNYKSKVKVDQKTVEIVANCKDADKNIVCDRYLRTFLMYPEMGYLDKTLGSNCISPYNDSIPPHIILVNSYLDNGSWENMCTPLTPSDFEKTHTIYMGNYSSDIYQRKERE
ncbi:MAG: hypothetical protein K6F33_01870 [Bacteroidales bacterium]|nr:hypothetical protein [Bacteroidales bacterium]